MRPVWWGTCVASALLLAYSAIAADGTSALCIDRIGGVKIGQSFSELRSTADRVPEEYGQDGLDCGFRAGERLPYGIPMRVTGGRGVRFELYKGGMERLFGIRVGEPKAAARSKSPEGVEITRHGYGGKGGHSPTWRAPGRDLGFRVETMDEKVSGMHWGEWEATRLIEGYL
ncbi:MAG: hypothetical protein LBL59_06350 [Xanthomonadaceae bacterium]|jgi:hypothetical protein|nr:hypothetical protein [Xanthomonadaceae bacterium]